MGDFLLINLVLLGFLLSAYGWGFAALCGLDRDELPRPGLCIALGVALWVLIGGYLNLVGLSYRPALDVLVVTGWVLVPVVAMWRGRAGGPSPRIPFNLTRQSLRSAGHAVVPLLVVLAMVEFYIATVMPTVGLNYHDDLHKYLVPPIAMLQTGEISGTPFDLLGRDYLGSQSFLQAFVLGRFLPGYVIGFDLIFCLLASGLLINDIGLRLRVSWVHRAAAIALLVMIHPQIVNISTVYAGVLMIFGMVYATVTLLTALDRDPPAPIWRTAALLGLFGAVLVSLKATFIAFACLHFAIVAMCALTVYRNRKHGLAGLAGALAAAAVTLVPWLLLSTNHYASLVLNNIRRLTDTVAFAVPSALASQQAEGDEPGASRTWLEANLSIQELFYGASMLDYTIAVALIVIGGLIALCCLRRAARGPRRNRLISAAVVAGAAAAIYVLFGKLTNLAIGPRYSIPLLIAALPIVVVLLGPELGRLRRLRGAALPALFVAGAGLVIGQFSDTFVDRVNQIRAVGSVLDYETNETDREYIAYALSDEAHDRFRGYQVHVPAGAGVLVWMSQPFHLDFARNRVWPVNSPGTGLDHVAGSFELTADGLGAYLSAHQIRYVIWEHRGFGMPTEQLLVTRARSKSYLAGKARDDLRLRTMLKLLARQGTVLFNAEGVIVFELNAE